MSEQQPPYRVRNANASDLAVVRQISADAYISTYMPVLGYIPKPAEEDYGARIARKEIWIMERDGYAIGVAVLEEHSHHLLVYSIAVTLKEQGQGYGRALLDFADRRAIAIRVPEIRLYTNTRMEKNIALYRRHGYIETGIRSHPSRPGETLIDMVRPMVSRS